MTKIKNDVWTTRTSQRANVEEHEMKELSQGDAANKAQTSVNRDLIACRSSELVMQLTDVAHDREFFVALRPVWRDIHKVRSSSGGGPFAPFAHVAECIERRPPKPYFFFQAEDGIRDDLVTGVQTCALPILIGFLHSTGDKTYGREQRGHPGPWSAEILSEIARAHGRGLRRGAWQHLRAARLQRGEIGRASCRERV